MLKYQPIPSPGTLYQWRLKVHVAHMLLMRVRYSSGLYEAASLNPERLVLDIEARDFVRTAVAEASPINRFELYALEITITGTGNVMRFTECINIMYKVYIHLWLVKSLPRSASMMTCTLRFRSRCTILCT